MLDMFICKSLIILISLFVVVENCEIGGKQGAHMLDMFMIKFADL